MIQLSKGFDTLVAIIFWKSKNVFLYLLNSKKKIKGLVLLSNIIFRHWNCFLSSDARDGKDQENGLKLEKLERAKFFKF